MPTISICHAAGAARIHVFQEDFGARDLVAHGVHGKMIIMVVGEAFISGGIRRRLSADNSKGFRVVVSGPPGQAA